MPERRKWKDKQGEVGTTSEIVRRTFLFQAYDPGVTFPARSSEVRIRRRRAQIQERMTGVPGSRFFSLLLRTLIQT